MAEDMHRQDGFGFRGNLLADTRGIETETVRQDVGEHRRGADHIDGLRRGENVNGVVMTSSPGPIPSARSDKYNESVPLATPMACFTPTYSAHSFSNACVCGPRTKLPRLPVSRIAASHSASNCLYCAVRSRNGTGMGLVTACIGKSSPSPAKRRATPPAQRGH